WAGGTTIVFRCGLPGIGIQISAGAESRAERGRDSSGTLRRATHREQVCSRLVWTEIGATHAERACYDTGGGHSPPYNSPRRRRVRRSMSVGVRRGCLVGPPEDLPKEGMRSLVS